MTSAKTLEDRLHELESRVLQLEDINAIRKLHFAYGYYIDVCRYADVVQLFSRDGEVVFLSGVYKGHKGIARLYQTWFHEYFTQGRPGPEYGFLLDHLQMQDIVTVSSDGKTAQGRFRALLAGGNHASREYKPEGLPQQFYEGGPMESGKKIIVDKFPLQYIREDGVWKIKRLDYVVQWQAEYEKGWANTEAHLKPHVVTYPENPTGPDELLPETKVRKTWPHRADVPTHYAHPVMQFAKKGP
ncbi:hypothetical protein JX266_001126 [Neoarthrinium moseri]|nr:hypothetical protein JX266_001126 [Neoarthrinium moseri]